MEQPAKKRRSDVGVRLTPRDLVALRWIGEQYALRFDQLQRLLASQSSEDLKTPGQLSDSSMRHAIKRWSDAGLVVYKKILADTPGVVWLTTAGYRETGLPFRDQPPALAALEHIYWCSQVRLWLLLNRPQMAETWRSERWQRHDLDQKLKQVKLPDALLTTATGEIAVELERTTKGPTRLADALKDRALVYSQVWYICPATTKKAVDQARLELEEFYRAKVLVFSQEQFL